MQSSIAYIFVNTECNSEDYDKAIEHGTLASKIFNEILEFKEVSTFTDYRRDQIIEKLNELQNRSKNFADEIKKKRSKT